MLLDKLAQWIHSVSFDSLPSAAIEKVKECITDVYGVALAGSLHASTKMLRKALLQSYGEGQCSVIGCNERMRAESAAAANAFAAHVLDFDDTCYAGIVHPSAVLFPTIMALGEELRISGKEIIVAYITALEIQGKIGEAVSPNLYMKGWFTTSVLGSIGSAAAAAKILQLNPTETRNTIGLSLCQAGGMRQNNGTSAKPYSAGLSSRNGIISARMAQNGLSASPDIIEGPEGFFSIYCDNQHHEMDFDRLGNPMIILSPGICFKPYPTCSSTHSAIEAVNSLVKAHGLNWRNVKSINCKTTPLAVKSLIFNNPATPEQAQFSMPFCIACSLVFGNAKIEHINIENLNNPITREIMGKVSMEATDAFGINGATSISCPEGAEVTIEAINGQMFRKFIGHAKGSPSNPFTNNELSSKFASCAATVCDEHEIERRLGVLGNLENLKDISILSRASG